MNGYQLAHVLTQYMQMQKKDRRLTTEPTDRKPVSNSDRLVDDAVGLPLCRRSYALLSEKSLILALQLLIKANEK
ncbi:hypothetical protein EDC96DRAFT_577829 [Choanephora cucurbitarum]|nr:hypothetical protein EDC96DRAFT_577829 [Choanephora cucurbitarum]